MKPDMTDQDLDHLLAELTKPDVPDGLTARIMAELPARKTGWRAIVFDLFGLDQLAIPAAGAIASLAVGLFAGYALVPADFTREGGDEAEIALALAFGTDTWLDLVEETSR